jgi:hypothetical protein
MEGHYASKGTSRVFYHRSCSIPGHWYRRGTIQNSQLRPHAPFSMAQYRDLNFCKFRTLSLPEFRCSKSPIYAVSSYSQPCSVRSCKISSQRQERDVRQSRDLTITKWQFLIKFVRCLLPFQASTDFLPTIAITVALKERKVRNPPAKMSLALAN